MYKYKLYNGADRCINEGHQSEDSCVSSAHAQLPTIIKFAIYQIEISRYRNTNRPLKPASIW